MYRKIGYLFWLTWVFIGELCLTAQAGMYNMPASVMDTTGTEKKSASYILVDAVGQGTPAGVSAGASFNLKAGFIYDAEFSLSLEDAIPGVIGKITDMLTDPDIVLSKQESKSLNQAIKFLEDALDALALYEASGDDAALGNALNKIKSAVNKMLAVSLDTSVYQKMLAQAAELVVTSRVNEIADIAGDIDPDIIQARNDLADGKDEILSGNYDLAVQSFVQAYNQAVLAL